MREEIAFLLRGAEIFKRDAEIDFQMETSIFVCFISSRLHN
jgi:hypothetical protein